MPLFPKREVAIDELASEMLSGFVANPGLFPHADVPGLKSAFDAYRAARVDQVQKLAMSHLATVAKYDALEVLAEVMRGQLKQAQVDAAPDPQRLGLIGWGPRAHRAPVDPPAQVYNFDARLLKPGEVRLTWRPPKGNEPGGPVRTYEVERRQQPGGGGVFSEWTLAGASLTPQITLEAQPKDVRLEYRVFAVNHGGRSKASNTVVL